MRSLETHKETHKREHSKNFKLNQKVVCDKCGKELGSSHSLKMHLETVHSQPTTRNIENISRIFKC